MSNSRFIPYMLSIARAVYVVCENPSVFVIYENPSDFPNKFVVREWKQIVTTEGVVPSLVLGPCTDATAVVDTLNEARAAIPEGRTKTDRTDDDDPVIVECWS